MEILISGAGITGLTLALFLQRAGHRPLIIEKAPHLRDAGYMIDFYGPGYDTAEALGLLPELEGIHYPIRYLSFLHPDGTLKFAVEYRELRKLFDNRHYNFLRGDLEQVLYAHVKDEVEIRFGTTVAAFEQDDTQIGVTLSDGTVCKCDLLVGADGEHSHVRGLVFGNERDFRHFMGYYTAAFILPDSSALNLRPDAFQTLTEPGRQVAVYGIRGGRAATFFVYRADHPLPDTSQETAWSELERVYGDMDWCVPQLLAHRASGDPIYFDAVGQVRMPEWHSGRVVLAGDACGCVSLLAGQGASMAMAGARALAELLSTEDDVEVALERYEHRVRPAVEERQAAAEGMARWFVPETPVGVVFRDLITRTSTWPGLSIFAKRALSVGGKL